MKGSIKVARVAGIDIGIHWTFWLLIGFFVFISVKDGASSLETLRVVAFIFALFTCVVLHELGHALTAKRFGIQTRDITLLPIGGLARLESIPERPSQELLIAIAGPLVNVVIAGGLVVLILAMGVTLEAPSEPGRGLMFQSLLVNLAFVNVLLVAFNMLPAFPMDGGRVLRAILATRLSFEKATDIAAKVGGVMAFLFAGIALVSWNPVLLFIALFVFIGGQAENRATHTRSVLRGLRVRDAMLTELRTLRPGDSLGSAVDLLLAGSQQDFPVLDHDRVVGLLTRDRLLRALAQGSTGQTIESAMDNSARGIDADTLLIEAMEQLNQGAPAAPVLEHGELVGLLTTENVGELLMLREAGVNARRPG